LRNKLERSRGETTEEVSEDACDKDDGDGKRMA
jgi:hypothetical protein